jgi:hypothetical protein
MQVEEVKACSLVLKDKLNDWIFCRTQRCGQILILGCCK